MISHLKNSNNQLEELHNSIWNQLNEGALSSKSEFHLGILCTISKSCPKSRTVVLRRVDIKNQLLIFHTDIRSRKVNEIEKCSNISWNFYSASLKVQIRLEGIARILKEGKLVEDQWKASKPMSKKCYLAEDMPASRLEYKDQYLSEIMKVANPSEQDLEIGRKNFAVVKTKINLIEWLYLKSSGHIRARFKNTKDGFIAEWLVP